MTSASCLENDALIARNIELAVDPIEPTLIQSDQWWPAARQNLHMNERVFHFRNKRR
jgi:hypothetical protein